MARHGEGLAPGLGFVVAAGDDDEGMTSPTAPPAIPEAEAPGFGGGAPERQLTDVSIRQPTGERR